HEANVKPLGIGDLVRVVEIADSEHETGVIRQHDVSVRRLSYAAESKILLKKVTGSRYVSDGKIDVIQFHKFSPSFYILLQWARLRKAGGSVRHSLRRVDPFMDRAYPAFQTGGCDRSSPSSG